jgi:small-conductance mechanosensitive channel
MTPTARPQEPAAPADTTSAEGILQSVGDAILSRGSLDNLILSVVIIAAVILLRRLVVRVVEGRIEDVRVRYRWAKGSAYVAFALVAVSVLAIWMEGFRHLGTFFGLLTAGLAIALKDPVTDMAGWIFILWRRPFDLGDRIQIGDHAGDVVDLRVFQFSILEIGNWVAADQSTGRIIHVPNARVFTESLANYTAQFEYLWTEIPVLVTFESDWRKAKGILEEIGAAEAAGATEAARESLRKASRKFLIFYQKLTPVVYTSVADSGVVLTLRYLCHPRARRGTAQAIWEAILDALAAHDDIDLAYPTTRAYLNPVEGKEGARAQWLYPPAASE